MKKPNILFVLSDDQGEWAMGCSGNTDIQTPTLDKLAKKGTRFDNFYCASPVCSPARASLITGKTPSAHGIQDWIAKGNMDAWKYPELADLPTFNKDDKAIDYLENNQTYMDVLANNGYVCSLSGKWHLGSNPTKRKAFENWYTIGSGGCHYYYPDIFDEGKPETPMEYVTDLITNRAIDYVDEMSQQEHPFYLSVHYTAPHSPWEAEEHQNEYIDLYKDCDFSATPDLPVHPWQVGTCPIGDTPEKRKENLIGYYAAITAKDAGLDKIIKKLEEKDLATNSIIIFTADNGMNMGHHGVWGKGNGTYPPNMYDSSIKVPLIVYDPRKKKMGQVCHSMLSQYDIFPTILELATCSYNLEPLQPGKSFVPLLDDCAENTEDRVVIYDEYSKTRMIKRSDYKYIHRYQNGPCEFYNLETDPDETINLYDHEKYQEIIFSMKSELESWFKQYSISKMDGRKYSVKGSGQFDKCYQKDAFNQDIEHYYSMKD